MKEFYTINDIAAMTGLTTRTVRNYIKLGLLEGEKIEGVWQFSAEAVAAFMTDKTVQPSIRAKKNGVVFDFLSDLRKKGNEACVILDFPVEQSEAMEISDFFCRAVNREEGEHMKFFFEYNNGLARVVLKGSEDFVSEVMKEYYE